MRIGIANGSRVVTDTLRRLVETASGHEVAWTAADGLAAVRLASEDPPDLVLLDIALPVLDGVETTRRIMSESPTTVLLVASSVSEDAARIFEAMGLGALDAVKAPAVKADGTVDGADALLHKLALLARLAGKSAVEKAAPPHFRIPAGDVPPLVVLGASTGGPRALADLLAALPRDLGAALVVIQHVDAQFASGLAEWLSSQARLLVRAAADGDRPRKGEALLAGSNDHLVLRRDLAVGYTPEPRDCPYRPSVDAFLESAIRYWPEPGAAVLLTGMGRDGAQGLLRCRAAGWHTIAQDEGTSVLYGMPKAAREIGAAVEILPLGEISGAVTRWVRERPGRAAPRAGKEPSR